jgi:hypothetical protein
MVLFRLRNFHLSRASRQDARWLQNTLERESARYGAHLRLDENNCLSAAW